MKTLFLIPARGGSKGVPNKNRKLLNGKPLLFYSIDEARKLANDAMICVSTDDEETIKLCEKQGLKVPFKRPAKLAKDATPTNDVIAHALAFYENKNIAIDTIVLLQPTSPFRKSKHILEALKLYTGKEDMVVGVKITKANPYYTLMEEGKNGLLKKSKRSSVSITRRQDAPPVYEVNGAIYIINVASFHKKKNLANFSVLKKYVMSEADSLDIDTELDWKIAEFLISANRRLQSIHPKKSN